MTLNQLLVVLSEFTVAILITLVLSIVALARTRIKDGQVFYENQLKYWIRDRKRAICIDEYYANSKVKTFNEGAYEDINLLKCKSDGKHDCRIYQKYDGCDKKYIFSCRNCGQKEQFLENELSKVQKEIIELQFPNTLKAK
jgi:hypothetical protein